ncbi:MAG TPA: ABC transporter permease [Chloroflexia bacterium]|nr:ABC transporter permease [Chloroflexia bacterium]
MATTIATIDKASTTGSALKRFKLLLASNFLMYVRNKAAMFWVVVFPVGLMLVFGALYGNGPIDPSSPNSFTIISYLTPGLIVLSLMSNGLVGNAATMANYREKGILKRIQTTPLPVWQLIMARVVMQATLIVGQAAIMLLVSVVVFNARYDWVGVLEATPWIVLGALMFMAMGQAIAALVKKVDTVGIVAQVINFPLMFLGGLWVMQSQMPVWLQSVSNWLPSTMVSNLVRAPMLQSMHLEPSMPMALSVLGVLFYIVASVAISARFFKWG